MHLIFKQKEQKIKSKIVIEKKNIIITCSLFLFRFLFFEVPFNRKDIASRLFKILIYLFKKIFILNSLRISEGRIKQPEIIKVKRFLICMNSMEI